MYLVTATEMQAMDRAAIETLGIPGRVLMENAGREATRVFLAHFADTARRGVGVVAGRGNNGGDGHVVARCLAHLGFPVTVYLLCAADRVAGDAAANLRLLAPLNIPLVEITDEAALARHRPAMAAVAVWVDAIFGTGLHSEVTGLSRSVIEFINRQDRPVFAVDIASGLHADTGRPCGACINAQVTATFAYPKVGQVLYPGAEHTGRLEIVDIGIPAKIAAAVAPRQMMLTAPMVRGLLPQRPADSHKGRNGHLLVVAGSSGKTGAAAMTANAALRVGAGLVTVGVARSLNPVMETLTLEAMTAPLPDNDAGVLGPAAHAAILALAEGKSCLALGPGLGPDPATGEMVRGLIRASTVPLVLDADALNHLADRLDTARRLAVAAVLTPHPGEMGRLIGAGAAAVQLDRVDCARRLAVDLQAHIVLKGARTLVADPDGTVFVNPTGNPGMAAGGMGDVLTGAIAGLIAQGVAPGPAARAAVYLHGAAADHLAAAIGPVGYLAGEVMQALPQAIAKLLREV